MRLPIEPSSSGVWDGCSPRPHVGMQSGYSLPIRRLELESRESEGMPDACMASPLARQRGTAHRLQTELDEEPPHQVPPEGRHRPIPGGFPPPTRHSLRLTVPKTGLEPVLALAGSNPFGCPAFPQRPRLAGVPWPALAKDAYIHVCIDTRHKDIRRVPVSYRAKATWPYKCKRGPRRGPFHGGTARVLGRVRGGGNYLRPTRRAARP
jgi:hypothetical protein